MRLMKPSIDNSVLKIFECYHILRLLPYIVNVTIYCVCYQISLFCECYYTLWLLPYLEFYHTFECYHILWLFSYIMNVTIYCECYMNVIYCECYHIYWMLPYIVTVAILCLLLYIVIVNLWLTIYWILPYYVNVSILPVCKCWYTNIQNVIIYCDSYHILWLWQKSRAEMICRKNLRASLGVRRPFLTR